MTDWTCSTCGTVCAGNRCPICVPWVAPVRTAAEDEAYAESVRAYFSRWGTAGE